jgi:hypothetical protein
MTSGHRAEKNLQGSLRKIGPSKAIERFLSRYGNPRTKASYAYELVLCFRWLKAKGVDLDPDAVIADDLKCVYESGPTDVSAYWKTSSSAFVDGVIFVRILRNLGIGNESLFLGCTELRGAEVSEEKDEAEAIEQEREAEATESVEPVSEAEGEAMEEETEEESEEHESEQIGDRRIKTTREEKRKHNSIARGRAADDGYDTREG